MNYGSEPADQVVRYSLEGAEFALRISGTAAKNFFIFAQAVLHDSKKTHGKTHLIRLLKEQKPLKFFTVDKNRMHDFARAAKAHALNSALAEPFALAWSQDSPRFFLVFTVIYAVVLIVAVSDQKNIRPGAEHGSAAWGDVFRLNKFYMDKRGPNLLLTQHFHIGIDGYKHKHNTNILIVGGSGAGKTRTYGVPNVLECACSMVITDPKAEILRKTGNLLKRKGYEVIVFDLINPASSFCYNPFVYVHDDREVLTLIENLIQNTTPSHSKSSDPFWEKSETALLQALMLYLLHEAPPEEQNFSMVMEMIAAAEVHEDDDNYQSPLDILFERLEMREPDSIACKQYRIFKQAAGDVCSK